MARKSSGGIKGKTKKKKTSIGCSHRTKWSHKKGKKYRKRPVGQGK